ncbi:hypothetical protein B0T19DRAFT_439222 [Cercophora scortea]|uniref:Uncharacterized protein n=1 Tax=Cercophora scortea TaxID=314031 RepID=A0AAE0MHH5_9PEZI|nr:hypothetical protein B0T19DRAFT_439222 [Cercophora scortea]
MPASATTLLEYLSPFILALIGCIYFEVYERWLIRKSHRMRAARRDLERANLVATDRPVDPDLLVAARAENINMIPLQPLARRRRVAPRPTTPADPDIFMMSGAIQEGDPLSSSIPEHFNMPDPVQDDPTPRRPAAAVLPPFPPKHKTLVRRPALVHPRPVRMPRRHRRNRGARARPVVVMEPVPEEEE